MKRSLLSLAVVTALSTSAFAADMRVSGFINVVAGVNDVNPDDYIAGKTSKSYIGYDDQYDFQKDSLAAIQFSSNFTDKMGATIQLIAQNNPNGDNIRMEWGYVSYDVTDTIRILAGRIRPALFLYSDYLDIGYAYTWITPPSEVYSQSSVTNIDGASVAYNLDLGDNQLSFTAFGGNTQEKSGVNADGTDLTSSYDNTFGGEIAYTMEYAKLRAGYVQTKISSTLPAGTPVELVPNDTSASFYGFGLSVDYENILFASEYTQRIVDETAKSDVTSYYAMIGYKLGDFTPNYTYAVADSDMDFATSGAGTDAIVNSVRAGNLDDRSSHTIGLRYDLNPKAALKFECNMATVTHSTYAGGTTLTEVDEDINTYRVALNIVF